LNSESLEFRVTSVEEVKWAVNISKRETRRIWLKFSNIGGYGGSVKEVNGESCELDSNGAKRNVVYSDVKRIIIY
jgi:hypothetical protein